MVDPVVQRATQQIAEQSVQQGASQGAGAQPSGSEQAKFESLMNGPADNVQAMQASQQMTPTAGTETVEGPRSLGDAILDSLDNVRERHDTRMENIQDKLLSTGGGEMTVQDAMALQFEVMQLGIEHELTTKVADKTSQGVQTLFHNQ